MVAKPCGSASNIYFTKAALKNLHYLPPSAKIGQHEKAGFYPR
jgi:hypothetical protein